MKTATGPLWLLLLLMRGVLCLASHLDGTSSQQPPRHWFLSFVLNLLGYSAILVPMGILVLAVKSKSCPQQSKRRTSLRLTARFACLLASRLLTLAVCLLLSSHNPFSQSSAVSWFACLCSGKRSASIWIWSNRMSWTVRLRSEAHASSLEEAAAAVAGEQCSSPAASWVCRRPT